jgi:hypothetical protein
MTQDYAGTVGEGERAASGGIVMREVTEEAVTEILEVFAVGFADLAEEETFEAGEALTIIGTELGEEPEGFAAAAGAAKADGGGAVGLITKPSSGTCGELTVLEDETGVDEVPHLIQGTAGGASGGG